MKIKAKPVLFHVFLLAFGVILLSHGTTAFAAGPITVSGKVTNMSQNGDPLDGLSVVLHENSADILGETEYKLSENNEFIFENIISHTTDNDHIVKFWNKIINYIDFCRYF